MSKETTSPSWGMGEVIDNDFLKRITGRVLTIVESLGLPEKQEKPVKDLLTQAIFRDEDRVIYIDDKLHTAIRHQQQIERREADLGSVPMGLIKLEDINK